MHVRAVIEAIRNDSLRAISYDLFTDEMGKFETLWFYTPSLKRAQ